MVLSTLRVLSVAVVAASLPAVPLGRHSVREGDREGGASTLEVQAAPQVSAVFRDAFRVERETLGREETPSLPSAPSPFQIVGDGPGSLQSFGWRARGSGGHQGDGQGDIAVSAAVVSEQKKEVTGGWSGWSISDWFPFFGRGREQEGGGGGNHTNAARRGVQRGGNSTWLHHYNRTSDGDGGGQSERNLTEPIEEIDPDSGLLKPVTDFGGPVQGGEGGHVSGYRGRGGEEAESRKATERREREPPSARLSVLEDPGFVQRCMQFLGYVDAHIDHVTSLDPAVVAFTSGMVPEDMHQHERGGGREGMSMSEDPYRPFKGAGAASLSSLSLPFTVSVGFSKPRAVSASDAMTFRLAGPDRDAFNLCVTQMIRPLTGSQRKDRHRSLVQGTPVTGTRSSLSVPRQDLSEVQSLCLDIAASFVLWRNAKNKQLAGEDSEESDDFAVPSIKGRQSPHHPHSLSVKPLSFCSAYQTASLDSFEEGAADDGEDGDDEEDEEANPYNTIGEKGRDQRSQSEITPQPAPEQNPPSANGSTTAPLPSESTAGTAAPQPLTPVPPSAASSPPTTPSPQPSPRPPPTANPTAHPAVPPTTPPPSPATPSTPITDAEAVPPSERGLNSVGRTATQAPPGSPSQQPTSEPSSGLLIQAIRDELSGSADAKLNTGTEAEGGVLSSESIYGAPLGSSPSTPTEEDPLLKKILDEVRLREEVVDALSSKQQGEAVKGRAEFRPVSGGMPTAQSSGTSVALTGSRDELSKPPLVVSASSLQSPIGSAETDNDGTRGSRAEQASLSKSPSEQQPTDLNDRRKKSIDELVSAVLSGGSEGAATGLQGKVLQGDSDPLQLLHMEMGAETEAGGSATIRMDRERSSETPRSRLPSSTDELLQNFLHIAKTEH